MTSPPDTPSLLVLGTAQDGGIPHAGCERPCCREAWDDPSARRRVASLGLIDPVSQNSWLVDATPDIRDQLHALLSFDPRAPRLAGILLTHAHMGHYTGLVQFGPESMNARDLPLHLMPRCRSFLEGSLPWRRLLEAGHLLPHPLEAQVATPLSPNLQVTPLLVPHRDEDTETIALRVEGPSRRALYLPDIDDWDAGSFNLEEALDEVDLAYLDGTFYSEGELGGRSLSEVPHPPIRDTMDRLGALPPSERAKVRFLHLNHTNPVHRTSSPEAKIVRDAGFSIAAEGETFPL